MSTATGCAAVNDVHGRATGDQVLCKLAHRLRAVVRGGDMVARLVGDEFAILIEYSAALEGSTKLAARVTDAFARSTAPILPP